MKQTPKGWPRLSSAIFYDDAAKAIDWLCQTFGFVVRLRVEGEGGRIEHSELTYGDALIMVAPSGAYSRPGRESFPPGASPRSIGGGNTQSILLFVDDVDEHCAHARAAGAVIAGEPQVHDYGEEYWADRTYAAVDCEGHLWWFTQRLRDQPDK
ncbi:MAG: VOC family protein [Bryobacteraceae bacterium]